MKGPGDSAFREARAYGADPLLPLFTAGLPAGRYEFQVWVRARENTSDYEVIASATAFVGAACSASALTVAIDEGGQLGLAASASCRFGTPEYRFLARTPGTSAFREIRPYGPDPRVFAFRPTGNGRWEFQVLVRVVGNSADDSSATASTVVGTSCQGAALVATSQGSQLSATAVAACQYGYPEYRFVAKAPGASAFAEVRPYGPDPYLQLPATPGRWELQVQVRAGGNASDWEAQATAVALVPSSCSGAALAAVRDTAGWVRLEASATCYSPAAYRFLFRRAGAPAFSEMRSYAADPSYAWYVGALPPGTYEVSVQARVAWNASAFETSATLPVIIDAP